MFFFFRHLFPSEFVIVFNNCPGVRKEISHVPANTSVCRVRSDPGRGEPGRRYKNNGEEMQTQCRSSLHSQKGIHSNDIRIYTFFFDY